MPIVLFSAILPFILWPIEIVLPYPHIIEEAAKSIFIYFILTSIKKESQYKAVLLSGFLFAFSESILYIPNLLLVGSSITIFLRLALTIPLHIGTMALMLSLGRRRKSLIIIGLGLAIIIHYLFNVVVQGF